MMENEKLEPATDGPEKPVAEAPEPVGATERRGIPNPLTELTASFRALRGAPAGFWHANVQYWLDGVAYFGMLTLLTMYLHDVVGVSDETGHTMVSIYAGLITGSMLVFGPRVDRLGLRRSLLLALTLFLVGRVSLTVAPALFQQGSGALVGFTMTALVVAAAGNGFMQPAVYAGVKLFTTERTAAMGYGLLYAGMNLGIVFIGLVSSRIRTGVHIEGLVDVPGFGIAGVFWFCVGVNVLMLLMLLGLFTRPVELRSLAAGQTAAAAQEAFGAEEPAGGRKETKPLGPRARVRRWFHESPISNGRFMFFIFGLMPVQTLFAYQWLVMPQYVTRAYSQAVADNMESIVNIANPLIIVLGVPVITALTRRVDVFAMMILGSFVSALPTFLFLVGPNFYLLMTYIVLFSVGEALWQPRFLQLAAELAPEGKTGAYIAYANIPWFMVKSIAGLWTGRMMVSYCPAEGTQRTELMWLIYGAIAMITPVTLVLARKWVRAGLEASPRQAAST